MWGPGYSQILVWWYEYDTMDTHPNKNSNCFSLRYIADIYLNLKFTPFFRVQAIFLYTKRTYFSDTVGCSSVQTCSVHSVATSVHQRSRNHTSSPVFPCWWECILKVSQPATLHRVVRLLWFGDLGLCFHIGKFRLVPTSPWCVYCDGGTEK